MRLPALALAPLLLALAAAPAGAVSSAAGEGDVALDAQGSMPAVSHGHGADPGVGDDDVAVRQGLRELEARWERAPAGASARVGIDGLEVRHGALARADASLDEAWAPLAPASPVQPYLGPDGVDWGLDAGSQPRHAGDDPLPWPSRWWSLGWGVGYDSVSVPGAFAGSSDATLHGQLHFTSALCAGLMAGDAPQRLPGGASCPDMVAALQAATPEVRIEAHAIAAAASLVPPRAAPAALPGGAPAVALPPEAGAAAGASHGLPGGALGSRPSEAAPLPAVQDQASGVPEQASDAGPSSLSLLLGARPLAGQPLLPLVLAGLAAAALPVWALYRRIQPSAALDHPVRERILELVRATPGIHESQLARAMGLRHTHVQYHLRVMAEAGILEAKRFGGLKCLFELGRLSPSEKALALSAHGRCHEVLLAVGEEPGIAQRALARRLGMSESSVKWHLKRLETSGLVRTERARGVKRAWTLPGVLPGAEVVEPVAAPPAPARALAVPRAQP